MIEIRNIDVCYGKQRVIECVDARVEKGELLSIIGANGCGKSTLLNAVRGALGLTGGKILVDGEDVSSMSRLHIARKIAYLPQGKGTPDMTVEQLVLHGRFPYLSYPRRYSERDRKIAADAMERVGISHLSARPLATLSGGMRQTAYIAMALAQDTDYILLDEPTTYLDISHQIALMKLLRKLCESGKGIVTVMHDLPLAFDFSDRVLALREGRVAVCATPAVACESDTVRDIFGVGIAYAPEQGKYTYSY